MRVLIVEDDHKLAAVLRRGLEETGLGVVVAVDGDEAVAAARAGGLDAIILDVMLPGSLDGFEVAAELRRHRVATPILMLSGRDAVEDRVRGLQSGADDYLLKPFAFDELLARLQALARRHLADRSSVLRVGEVSLDTAGRVVSVAGRRVRMTGQELALLEHFMLHPGQVLTRTQLVEHAWPEGSTESNLVEVYVSRVRRKLMAAGAADPITTVRGLGYRMETGGG